MQNRQLNGAQTQEAASTALSAPSKATADRLANMVKAGKIRVPRGMAPDDASALEQAIRFTIECGATGRVGGYDFPPIGRARPATNPVARLFHWSNEEDSTNPDWVINTVLSDVEIPLDVSVLADMFRRPGYATPAATVAAQGVVGGGGTLSLTIGGGAYTGPSIEVAALLVMFYANQFINLGQLVGGITGTLSNGQTFDSLDIDVFPTKAGKYLNFTIIPWATQGPQLFPSPVEVSTAEPVVAAWTLAPVNATMNLIAVTSTHAEYKNVVARLTGCPGHCDQGT